AQQDRGLVIDVGVAAIEGNGAANMAEHIAASAFLRSPGGEYKKSLGAIPVEFQVLLEFHTGVAIAMRMSPCGQAKSGSDTHGKTVVSEHIHRSPGIFLHGKGSNAAPTH